MWAFSGGSASATAASARSNRDVCAVITPSKHRDSKLPFRENPALDKKRDVVRVLPVLVHWVADHLEVRAHEYGEEVGQRVVERTSEAGAIVAVCARRAIGGGISPWAAYMSRSQ